MRISLSLCKQAQLTLTIFPPGELKRDSYSPWHRKDKVLFVMGATGTGKSRLSIDLAKQFPAEIINSDKIQVHEGLDIVTNKVTKEEQRGIPHHLLGVIDPEADFTADDFRHRATTSVESIVERGKLPIIVGGSNSYIEALVDGQDFEFRSKYECCFIWVDVSLPVLHSFVSGRVDKMVEAGLVDEVRRMFDPANADYTRGIRRAIGLPELDQYLRAENTVDGETRARMLEEAIDQIKSNTCKLACRQLHKIHRLQSLWGWNVHRIDATHAFQCRGDADDSWKKLVTRPSTLLVAQFLLGEHRAAPTITTTTMAIAKSVIVTVMAAATW